MVDMKFPWDIELHERLNKNRISKKKNIRIPNIVKIASTSVWILLASTQVSHWQNAPISDCFVEINGWENNLEECDLSNAASPIISQEPYVINPDNLPEYYRELIHEIYDDGDYKLPENFDQISREVILPLHNVLISLGYWDVFTWDDVANITVLAMLKWREGFQEQYDYVSKSFPNEDISSYFKSKLAELFNPFSNI